MKISATDGVRGRLLASTRISIDFFNRWLDLIEDEVDLAQSAKAGNLVSSRERQIKGGRARLEVLE